MHYGLIKKPELKGNDCLVLGLFSDEPFAEHVEKLNAECGGLIQKLAIKLASEGDYLWQSEVHDHSVLLIQCGKKSDFTITTLQKRLSEIVPVLIKQKIKSATLSMPLVSDASIDSQLEQTVLQTDYEMYQFLEFKTKKSQLHVLNSIDIYLPNATNKALSDAIALADGISLTRNLANLPANICTPSYLAEQAKILDKHHKKIVTTVIEADAMKAMGMGALMAVAQGSIQPPKLVEIKFLNGGKKPTVVLVGKGITFDSGGISLKPANAMEEMKYDMAGAASVLGVVKACALLDLPINLIGLLACAENMPSGSAVKPGDIVTSMSGQTIEIVNTDAEGRLVLADALTYAERFDPEFVIDIATLTGAVIVALGHVTTGFMTKNEDLAARILKASQASMDKAWRLPLDEAYDEALESPIADMLNATYDRSAGSITAACFLAKFTEKYPWAHLDIAGTAWVSGKKRTATGRPVPLLTQLLRQIAHAR